MAWPELHPAAERELAEAIDWYEAARAGLGARMHAAVDDVMSRIASTPELYTAWREDPRYRRAVLQAFPYAIFYRVFDSRVVVMAVAHTSRRPGYWLSR